MKGWMTKGKINAGAAELAAEILFRGTCSHWQMPAFIHIESGSACTLL